MVVYTFNPSVYKLYFPPPGLMFLWHHFFNSPLKYSLKYGANPSLWLACLKSNFIPWCTKVSYNKSVMKLYFFICDKTTSLLSFVNSILLFGLYNDGFFNIPTNIADSEIDRSMGSLLKYTLDADFIPTALLTQSNLFKYIVIISSFVYLLSSWAEIIHSFSFWVTLSTPVLGLSVNNIFANCWVMVLAPPALFFPNIAPITALINDLTSTPECSLNLISSVEINASIKFSGSSENFALVLFSKKYFPNTSPSSDIICVAKLFSGFSNWSKLGSSPK